MKGMIYGGLTALLLTTGMTIAPNTVPAAQAQMRFNFTAPLVIDAGVLGRELHFIRVAVTGMALEDLMINLPQQMEAFDTVRVLDQSGKEVPATIQRSKERVGIVFKQPVSPENTLEVRFAGVQARNPLGQILLYRVTGKQAGIQGEIPIGTAQVVVRGQDG